MRKKTLLFVLSILVLLYSVPVSAYDLPGSFWSLNENYGNALNSKNYRDVVLYGSQVIDLISKEPSNEQTDNIMGSRLYDTAFACFYTGEFEKGAEYFKQYIPYGEKNNWTDGIRIAKEFVKQLTPELNLYEATDQNPKFYNAKNEPNGVLYGQVSEKEETSDSMVLLYLEYGYENEFDWAKVVLKNAQKNGKAVELALNFPNQGQTAKNISNSDSYLEKFVNLVSEFKNVPIYLRIGAEVNIWGSTCTPDEFKNAFKTIASRVKNFDNVATVYGVAHTDPWQSETRPYTTDDFYPGDDLVDYVGITIYCNRYFEGKTYDGVDRFNEICFKTGYSSDPVLMIKDFVEKYSGRKPVIISECGSAYYTGGEMNTYHHEWAAQKLKEIYINIPLAYPEVKLIAYFNKNMPNEANYYDLTGSELLQNTYDSINSPVFLKNRFSGKAERFYKKIESNESVQGGKTVCAYAHLYGADTVQVDYYLNGKWFDTVREIPFETTVPNSSGILHIVATDNNGNTVEKDFKVSGKPLEKGEFTDTDSLNDFQKNALKQVALKGIINGYEDSSFKPYETVTRAEFATIVSKMMGYSSDKNCDFSDAKDHWASKFINSCVEKGAVSGIGNNKFAPEDSVTGEQAFKIITVIKGLAPNNASYPDGFINSAVKNGLTENLIISNYSDNLSRIDTAVMIFKALD